MTKIGVVSLGCDKNRIDSEVMLANLVNGGYEITPDPSFADVIIVNTCAFLESSRKEAIDTILEMAEYKTNGNCKKIVVTGCLGQKFGKEVFDALTEADAVMGTNDYDKICNVVEDVLKNNRRLYENCNHVITCGNRVLTTPKHYAYLKIADGCDNFCTYCLIPHIRGRFRSVPMEQLVEQAKVLASGGVKELILVAQDVTRYGKDLYGSYEIVNLIRKLSEIDGIQWIRLLYCYPEITSDSLIDEIVTNNKVCKYIDIPLQHVNDTILKKMNRRSTSQTIATLFDKLSQTNINVRSTFICGFPYETNESVDEVENFLKKYKLRNVGFFAYSREEGTPSFNYENQLTKRKKDSIVRHLYKVQHKVASELCCEDVGKTYKCIIDDFSNEDGDNYVYVGRTEFMAPEIDGIVYVISPVELTIGNMYDVTITNALEYDLMGEVKL